VCLIAVFWRYGPDVLAIVVSALVLVSLGAGVWCQLHPPKDEGLDKQMFPDD